MTAEYLPYLVDGAALAIVILFILISANRGLITSVIKLVGTVLSFLGALLLSTPLAIYLYRSFFENGVTLRISQALAEHYGDIVTEVDSLSQLIQSALGSYPIDLSSLPQEVVGQTTDAAAQLISAMVVEPLMVMVLRAFCFFVLFCIFGILCGLLAKLFTGVRYLPVVGRLNQVLGAVFGAVQGVLIVAGLAVLLAGMAQAAYPQVEWLDPGSLQQSYVMRAVEQLDLSALVLGEDA